MGPDDATASGSATATAPADMPYVANPNAEADPSPASAPSADAAPYYVADPNAESAPPPAGTPATAPQAQAPHKNWFQKVYDGVLTGLGGATTTTFTVDQGTGKVTQHDDPATPGQKWKRIVAGALSGLAAGGGQTGPGAGARSLSLGVGGGIQAAQQAQQQQRQQAYQASDQQMKAAQVTATTAHLQQETAKAAWDLSWSKAQAITGQAQQEMEWDQRVQGAGEGSRNLGVFSTFQDYVKATQADPSLHDAQAKGQLFQVPHVNDKGEIDGIHVYQVAPTWLNQKNDKPVTIRELVPGEKVGDPPHFEEHVIPANSDTNQNIENYRSKVNGITLKAQDDWQKTQTDQQKATIEGRRATIEGRRANIEAQRVANEASKIPSEIDRNEGEAAAANARANKDQGNVAAQQPGGLVDQIGMGKLGADRLMYLAAKNPELLEAVSEKYPDFDSSKIRAYGKTYEDFTSGKTSVQLNSGGTALQHLNELKNLNTPKSHIPHSNDWTAYQNKADTVANELAKFYGNSTLPAIAAIKDTLTSTWAGNREEAIRTQAKSMGDKLDNFEQTWTNAAPSKAYEAAMPTISAQAKDARAALDPDYHDRRVQELKNAPGTGAGGAAGQLPQAAHDQVVQAGGKPVTFGNGQVWQTQNGQPVRIK